MLRLVVIVVVVVAGFLAYARLTAPSGHDRAVASLKRTLSEGATVYTSLTCAAHAASANAFARAAFGGGVAVYDCRVVTPTGTKPWCVAVGGHLSGSQAGLQEGTTCAHLGEAPAGIALPSG
jgi:hypothetical protein